MFDPNPIFAALNQPILHADHWTLTALPVSDSRQKRIYKGTAPNESPIAIKVHESDWFAEREFNALTVLQDFGINIAPVPLALSDNMVIMSWLEGQPLTEPPALDQAEMWQRMMSAFGASGEISPIDYSHKLSMGSFGYRNPIDLLDQIEEQILSLEENTPLYATLFSLLEIAAEQIPHEWTVAPKIGLVRNRHSLDKLIWDGHHLLTVDWCRADWGDMAAEIGLWSAHPDYEQIPAHHWTWVRWEFARLVKDPDLVARATTYAHLGQLWWAAHLAATGHPDTALQERYLARARKLFR